jgi:curved DNA-binding protein CbpA
MLRYYQVLEIDPNASMAEIRRAYVDLVRVWHSDRFSGDARLQSVAEQKLKEINQAYGALEALHASEADHVANGNGAVPAESSLRWRPSRR